MAKKELLAPVGSYEAMVAAVNAGCDAIYTGGRLFGARAFANNFNNDELIDVINYCHLRQVAVYLTVNTLLSDDEIEEYLFDYLKPLYEAGLDAVIIQDIGVLEYISRHFPDLPIHLSTQFTSTTHISSKMFENYNITRVVTPRELSLKEIEEYASNTSLEIETFIHGALCYCYSGQCLMSALVGGRSGNRGKCAQPCRKDYYISGTKEGKAILSLKDLCTLDLLPQLMESGIYSFKIEGRMKKPEYVGIVVSVYRKYMDLYEKLGSKEYAQKIMGQKEYEEDKIKLADIYNRGGFTEGYMKAHNSKDINCTDLVSHYGTKCGMVTRITPKDFAFKATISLNSQDVLQIRDERQRLIYEFTLKEGIEPHGVYNGRYQRGLKLKEKMSVYRVRNNNLLEEINKNVINNQKKLPISIKVKLEVDKPIQLKLMYKKHILEMSGEVCQKAEKAPITEDNVKSKLTKLGNTCFICDDIDITIEGDVFVSATVLNELRREGIAKLASVICGEFSRKYNKEIIEKICNVQYELSKETIMAYAFDYSVACDVVDAYESLKVPSDFILAIEMVNFSTEEFEKIALIAKKQRIKLGVILPWIMRYKNFDVFNKTKNYLFNNRQNIDYIIVRNYEEYELLKDTFTDNIKFIADTTIYAYNTFAAKKLKSLGIDMVSSPVEFYNSNAEVVTIYGNRPVMASAGCVKKTLKGCNANNESIEFVNDKGDKYFSKCICDYCMNMIYTSDEMKFHYNLERIAQNGHVFRLNFTKEDKNLIKDVIDKTFKAILENKE